MRLVILIQNNLFSPDQSISPASLLDPNTQTIKLPEGIYTICFSAKNDIGNATLYHRPKRWLQQSFYRYLYATINGVLINTIVNSPVNPFIAQTVSDGGINSTLQFNNPTGVAIPG